MLETAILLTCLEATMIALRVENNYNYPRYIRDEIIIEVLSNSECTNGHV